MKPTLIYKTKLALMSASLLASFPFQLWFISSNISIKHLVSSHYGAQFCAGCPSLSNKRKKHLPRAHGGSFQWWVGERVSGWVHRHTHRQCFRSTRGRLDPRGGVPALSLHDKAANLSTPVCPACRWGMKGGHQRPRCCHFIHSPDFLDHF